MPLQLPVLAVKTWPATAAPEMVGAPVSDGCVGVVVVVVVAVVVAIVVVVVVLDAQGLFGELE